MKLAKVLGVLFGGWFVSLALAFVVTIVVAGLTSHWGPGRAGNALMMLWAGVGLLFLMSGLVVLLLLRVAIPGLLARLGITLAYLLPLAVAGFMWAGFTLVLFNR